VAVGVIVSDVEKVKRRGRQKAEGQEAVREAELPKGINLLSICAN
jgi:hypothetical protein